MSLRYLTKPMYSNCVILHPDGKVLCRSGEKRMNWYLARGLAEKVSENPPTIKLNFKPAGEGDVDDAYMLADKDNLCVVCGTTEQLTKHHVVPYSYRIHFPESCKRHTSYDILPVCVDCHESYEIHARQLRRDLLDERKIVENGDIEIDWDAGAAIKASHAILNHGPKIPAERMTILKQAIKDYLEKAELTDADIAAVSEMQWQIVPEDYACASKKIVDTLTSIDEFAKRWREHFITTMTPKHMPEHWTTDKKLYDTGCGEAKT